MLETFDPGYCFCSLISSFVLVISNDFSTISPQFDLPVRLPFVKMPLAASVGETQMHEDDYAVGATSTFTVPPGAATFTYYTVWKYMLHEGFGSQYDEGGLVRHHAYATETDKSEDVSELRLEFYDSNGVDLGVPGMPSRQIGDKEVSHVCCRHYSVFSSLGWP